MGEQCGVYKALNLIGNKWTLVVLRYLCTNPRGFNELHRLIDGISPKVLSDRLRELVAAGLVHKEVFPTTPPTVEYTLTEKGRSLKPIIDSLDKWGEQAFKA
jgi:DNA-binding HxlR family transcriptional regulator